MKMLRDERRLDIRPTEFAADTPCCRALPERVLDIYDRRHQGNETQVALNQRNQRADPSAVTGGEQTKFARAAFAQCAHQLAHLGHALAQPFCVADQIAGDRQFTVPIAARDTRIMVWQPNETRVPAKLVEMLCATSIADGA